MRTLAESNNAKTVVLPASTPGGYNDMFQQMVSALETGNVTSNVIGNAGNPVPRHQARPAGLQIPLPPQG